jgi:TadE-like protein
MRNQNDSKPIDQKAQAPGKVQSPGRERGVALIEFALVLPLMVTILFGAIDFGFVSSDTTKLRQAVRETARRASVWRFGRSVCDDSPAGVAMRGKLVNNHELLSGNSIPQPDPNVDDTRVTQARKVQCQLRLLSYEAGLDVRTKILVVAEDADYRGLPPLPPPCVVADRDANANPYQEDVVTGDPIDLRGCSFRVVICAQFRTSSRTGFFGPLLNHKILRSAVTMRIASLSISPQPPYPSAVEEDPISIDGKPGNWGGCTASAT